MTLYSYKMTGDTGFAPNPFHGYMTLATCKPGIRKNKNINPGIFIAGFTSQELYDRIKKPFPGPRMVFIMNVTERISFHSYWNDSRFQCKKPPQIVIGSNAYTNNRNVPALLTVGDLEDVIDYVGDNIYEPVTIGDNQYFIHHDNISHPCKYRQENETIEFASCKWRPCQNQFFEIIDPDVPRENYNKYRKQVNEDGSISFIDLVNKDKNHESFAQHDLKGLNVLVSNDFFYFGREPLDVIQDFNIKVPEYAAYNGEITENIEDLWFSLKQRFYSDGVLNTPHFWP